MRKVIITCALTGGGAMTKNSKHVPVTPRDIAQEGIAAAKAGAAVVHIHVRDPETGAPEMRLDLYREVVARVRDSGTEVLINLTTGMGATYNPPIENPARADILPVRRPSVSPMLSSFIRISVRSTSRR